MPIPVSGSKISTDAANNCRRHLKDICQNLSWGVFSGYFQPEVGIEFLAAGGTSHQHPADIGWKP
jgi:hypothetical protein